MLAGVHFERGRKPEYPEKNPWVSLRSTETQLANVEELQQQWWIRQRKLHWKKGIPANVHILLLFSLASVRYCRQSTLPSIWWEHRWSRYTKWKICFWVFTSSLKPEIWKQTKLLKGLFFCLIQSIISLAFSLLNSLLIKEVAGETQSHYGSPACVGKCADFGCHAFVSIRRNMQS